MVPASCLPTGFLITVWHAGFFYSALQITGIRLHVVGISSPYVLCHFVEGKITCNETLLLTSAEKVPGVHKLQASAGDEKW